MGIASEMRQAVLQAAIQGKLTEQLSSDGSAAELLVAIKAEKERLIAEKVIKKEKVFPPIAENNTPFDIPENWMWVRLCELLRVKPSNGLSPKAVSHATKIKSLSLTATTSGYFKPEAFKYVDISELEAERYFLQDNDILIQRSNSRELVGTSCIYREGEKKFIYPDLMMRIHLMDGISTDYIDMVLKAPLTRAYYQQEASGTSGSMPKINQQIVCATLIPLPPNLEQERIVARVNELTAKIDDLEKTENELAALHKAFPADMKAAVLQAAMQGRLTEQLASDGVVEQYDADYDDIPENWSSASLGRICEIYTGNSISETEKAQKYTGIKCGYDFIATKDVGFDHRITYNNGVHIPHDEINFRVAHKDATLLCIEGGSAGRKIAMLDRDVCFGNKLCMFFSQTVEPKFLYYFLQSPNFTCTFTDSITGIIGGVSIRKLKAIAIPIPPLAEQMRIVERLDQLLPLCDDLAERSA